MVLKEEYETENADQISDEKVNKTAHDRILEELGTTITNLEIILTCEKESLLPFWRNIIHLSNAIETVHRKYQTMLVNRGL